MAKLTRLQQLQVKHETTMGTDIVPTEANALKAYELDFQPIGESTTTERKPVTGVFGPVETDVAGAFAGAVKFKTYMVGSGTLATAPAWGILMPACGWGQNWTAATSVVYSPASVYTPAAWTATSDHLGAGSVSMYSMMADSAGGATAVLGKLKGCMGSFELALEMGKPGTFAWDFKGSHVSVVGDQTMAQATLGAEGAIYSCLNVGATWTPSGGSAHTPVMSKFTLKSGGAPILVDDMNDSSGYIHALITDRVVAYSCDLSHPVDFDATAGADWWGHLKQTAAASGVLEVGPVGTAGSGNRWAVSITKAAVGGVKPSDKDGRAMLTIEGKCTTTDLTVGSDEVTITFD